MIVRAMASEEPDGVPKAGFGYWQSVGRNT